MPKHGLYLHTEHLEWLISVVEAQADTKESIQQKRDRMIVLGKLYESHGKPLGGPIIPDGNEE